MLVQWDVAVTNSLFGCFDACMAQSWLDVVVVEVEVGMG